MIVIDLSAIPNQSFTTTQDGDRYEIDIIYTNGCMSVNITKNSVLLIQGFRATLGWPLLPFPAIGQGNGNFTFIGQTDDLVDYTLFGSSQQLIYFNYEEFATTS